MSSKHLRKGIPGLQLAVQGSGKTLGLHKSDINLKSWCPGMLPIAEVWALLSGSCSSGCPPAVPHWDFSVLSHMGPQTSLSLPWGESPVGLEKPGWCLGGFKGSLKWLHYYNGMHSGREPLWRRTRGCSHTLEIWVKLFQLHTCK